MENKTQITEKKCKYCGKIIASLYPKQAEANMEMHERFCKDNPQNQKEELENEKKN
ncbi:MAG: hypothetical protein ACOC56_03085 [Atribacterota bacterium]